MEFLDVLKKRRSIRQYTGEEISKEQLQMVLNAGLLSPSSRSIRPWELIVVQNKDTLKEMSECRIGSAKMLANASAAIVVVANTDLMADSLGLGSCWIQGRLREASDGQTTEDYLRRILGYPKEIHLEAILSLGIPAVHPEGHSLTDIPENKIHYEKYGNTEML